ncbi:DpnD/PcfM family protein [Pseudoramibacter faecis]|uniref:DpnD/PcfM family protein n=1 Tax=Pseudoramibacter faecis TaxID=3108534 RepID=UPI002E77C0E0|nr:DpnD/PcfM family protein [Pseudoramibacter sp. HA2172]
MKEYEVTITETLKKTVTVEAESEQDARDLVDTQWRNSEHILDADYFQGVEFSARPKRRSRDMER